MSDNESTEPSSDLTGNELDQVLIGILTDDELEDDDRDAILKEWVDPFLMDELINDSGEPYEEEPGVDELDFVEPCEE